MYGEIKADPDGFIARHPRLMVSFHKQTAEQFAPRTVAFERNGRIAPRDPLFHIWEDIAKLRRVYEQRHCTFTLMTLLREPTSLYLSDYLFEGVFTGKSLSDFMGQDVQSAALLGWPNGGWMAKKALDAQQRNQTFAMLDGFDIVGVTERFDESLLLLAKRAGLPYPMYRVMNSFGASSYNKRMAEQLRHDQATSLAIEQLTSFDRTVYEHYRRRFDETIAAEGAGFENLLAEFRNASVVSGRGSQAGRYVGGLPPNDKLMVTSAYRCNRSQHVMGTWSTTDYGGCVTGLGEPGGPKRLDALKKYIPCDQATCTKISADGYACSHVFGMQGAATPPGGVDPAAAPLSKRRWVECKVDSSPDGLM